MDDLSKWANELSKWSSKLDTYSITTFKPKKPAPVKTVEKEVAPTRILTDILVTVDEFEDLITETEREKHAPDVSWGELDRELARLIDEDYPGSSWDLSSGNPCMIYSYAVRRGLVKKVGDYVTALAWNDYFKRKALSCMVNIWGTEPLNKKCKTCKESEEQVYSGLPPADIESCKRLLAQIRYLSGYKGKKTSLLQVMRCYEHGEAVIAVQESSVDIFRDLTVLYPAWIALEICRSLHLKLITR